MKLDKFDGGLNIRVDPSLALPNEAVIYSNIDNSTLVLQSSKDITVTDQHIQGQFYNFNGQWLNSDAERSYVEYKNILYYSEIDKPVKKNKDGQSPLFLGILAPTGAVTVTQANPIVDEEISEVDSILQYVYTFYNSDDGTESAPSPISNETAILAHKVVDLTDFDVSSDPQVDTIRIYRIGDNVTEMTLVMEVPNDNVITRDAIKSVDLEAHILDTYTNQTPIVGMKYLTEAYGILFGAVGSKLYFAKQGQPNYWPAADFANLPHDITGLLPVPNGLLVHTEFRTLLLVGTKPEDFNLLPVSKEQGSIAHLSGKEVTNVPVWISHDGVCSYTAGVIQVLSKDKLGKRDLVVVNTCVWDEQYFMCLSDGTLLVMDGRFNGKVFKQYTFSSQIDNILCYNDTLYGRVGEQLVTLFTGDDLAFTYKSPEFTENEHAATKLYGNIYMRAQGDFNFKLYIDGNKVMEKELSGNIIHDILPPQEKQRGTSLQMLISGIGTIYAIDYKVQGRQNGR